MRGALQTVKRPVWFDALATPRSPRNLEPTLLRALRLSGARDLGETPLTCIPCGRRFSSGDSERIQSDGVSRCVESFCGLSVRTGKFGTWAHTMRSSVGGQHAYVLEGPRISRAFVATRPGFPSGGVNGGGMRGSCRRWLCSRPGSCIALLTVCC